MSLRAWQQQAIQLWENNRGFGTIQAATGAGKTRMAVEVIKKARGNVLVIVPTINLLEQWVEALEEEFTESIGKFYGKEKKIERILVATINSIRDKKITSCELLVYDEVHHGQSQKSYQFLLRNHFRKVLGLSATPHMSNPYNDYILKLAPIIYQYTTHQAINDGVLSDYDEKRWDVGLTSGESEEYEIFDEEVKTLMAEFDYDFTMAQKAAKKNNREAIDLLKAVNGRKQIIYYAQHKLEKAQELILKDPRIKTIVFDERIQLVESLYDRLNQQGVCCGLYHSQMKSSERKEMLDKFRSGEIRILLSAKALEEGVDVPDAHQAIILNRTSQARQFIQRLGRVLRLSPDKERALLHQIYVGDTVDERWMGG